MWARQVILAVIGLSSGIAVAGGLFSFIIGLGVVSDFADRTHTGANVILYEEMIALGGILGNIMYVYQICIPGVQFLIGPVGFCAGIFVGCWSMALAEILNTFPIIFRRFQIKEGLSWIMMFMALGKCAGAFWYFGHHMTPP